MIAVTERAAQGLRAFLEANRSGPEQGVKLIRCCRGGIGMTVAEPGEGDEVVCHRGERLLIVDGHLAESLRAAVMDCESLQSDGRDGLRFRVWLPGERGARRN